MQNLVLTLIICCLKPFFPKSAVSGEKQKDFVEKLGEDLNKMDPVAKSFVDFTEKEIRDAIISLGCFKAPGPDGIPGVALHCTIDVLMPFWVKLFNSCGRLGYFPEFWKKRCYYCDTKTWEDRLHCAKSL